MDKEIHLIVCDPDYVQHLLDYYYKQEESSLNDLLRMMWGLKILRD